MAQRRSVMTVLRLARGLKQSTLSNLTNITQSTLSEYETLTRAPRRSQLDVIAGVLGWTRDPLLLLALYDEEYLPRFGPLIKEDHQVGRYDVENALKGQS